MIDRRAARRAVDRHADEAGAGRSADGAVRAQLGVAGAGARRGDARRLLLRRDRGGARRAHLPHAGVPALATRISRTAPSRGGSPTSRALEPIEVEFAAGRRREFLPYKRDPETLARPWAIPGTPGLEHRIGGLEKANETGNVSYDPENHDLMTQLRAQKVAGIEVARPSGRPPGGRRRARALVGRHVRAGARRRAPRARGRRQGGARASALAEPVPGATSATCCGATTAC